MCEIPQSFSQNVQSKDSNDVQSHEITQPELYLVLDGVSDPGNVGTLIRSCASIDGVNAVFLIHGSADVFSPKTIRSSMGACFHLPIQYFTSFSECLQFMEQSFYPKFSAKDDFFAATMESSTSKSDSISLPHYLVDWSGSESGVGTKISALCIGKEGSGLSQDVRDAVLNGSIKSVHVPMSGDKVESLNAAVCGSVILFEFSRQRELFLSD